MIPVNAGVYPQDTVTNPAKNELLLQIPIAHVGVTITWLMEQAIPFELRFSQTPVPKPTEYFSNPEPLDSAEEQELIVSQKIKPASCKAIEAIYKKYIENPNMATPNVSAIAEEAGMKVQAFKKNFQLRYQKTFTQAHLEKRMQRAAVMLREGYPCNQVAQMVGYADNSAIKFNKMFQKHYGMTPKRYQLQKRDGNKLNRAKKKVVDSCL